MRIRLLLAILSLAVGATTARADDWPQWLGPNRDAGTPEKIAPWRQSLRVLWKQPVGEGNSSPVVASGRVFLLTKVKDQTEERLQAFDAQSGKELWNKVYSRAAFKSLYGNGPRATPAVAGGRVYTFGITGVLTCWDAQTGNQVWQVDTLKEFNTPNLFFGLSCSPLVEGGQVIVDVGGKGASIVAFDAVTGKVAWKSLDDKASYASPIVFGQGANRQVVFLTGQELVGLKPSNGSPLWRFPFVDLLMESSTTPVHVGDMLVGSSITVGSVGLQLKGGDKPSVEQAWKNPDLTCYFSTPVAVGTDQLYLVTGTKPPAFNTQANLHCVDPKTGKVHWTRPKVGKYHASLLRTRDNKLLLLEEAGDLVLLDPNPGEYRELARARVCGETWAHPAVANGKLYVRDNRELVCLELGTHESAQAPAAAKPAAVRLAGFGNVHHPVSTTNAEAQAFFDQGLRLVYAFNHAEAVRAFEKAAKLDPNLAMAHWGVALALGPNINADVDPEQEKAAHAAVERARKLADAAPEHERAYIEALALRYSPDPKADLKALAVRYRDAMKRLAERYTDDLDAATLYAESCMNLRPWKLYDAVGKPAEGTEEIVAVLESVLRRNPEHTGANHYYIHAVEASNHPEWALPSASRLGTLAPAAGHLVHMPSHIYMRTGDYAQAAECNARAAAADETYFKESRCAEGIYPMMYYSHNLHFLSVAHAMQGRYEDAQAAADKLVEHVKPHVEDMPMLEGFLPTALFIQARFQRWEEILKVPAPPPEQKLVAALRHFARGLALAGLGRAAEAEHERAALAAAVKALPEKAMYSPLNTAHGVLDVALAMLDGQLALAHGDKKGAVTAFRNAVTAEDALAYAEPPDWYLPAREPLGRVLSDTGEFAEAERIYREELRRSARSGRALFGLEAALRSQGKTYAADLVHTEFVAAWRNAKAPTGVRDP